MLDHVSIPVADLERAARFYDEVLATLGLRRCKERRDRGRGSSRFQKALTT
ncbi:MAG: VOC family protein [Candidatus Binatia bacterium]